MINAARIGATYITGSSFSPEHVTVTHLVGFADLSEQDQARQTLLGKQHGYDPRNNTYVWYRAQCPKCPERGTWTAMLPEDVFLHVVYATERDFYARPTGPVVAGLLRCTLPGEH